MTEDLLPCPFCGGLPIVCKWGIIPDTYGDKHQEVRCVDCGASNPLCSAWNTRTPSPSSVTLPKITGEKKREALNALVSWVCDGDRFTTRHGRLSDAERNLCEYVPTIQLALTAPAVTLPMDELDKLLLRKITYAIWFLSHKTHVGGPFPYTMHHHAEQAREVLEETVSLLEKHMEENK